MADQVCDYIKRRQVTCWRDHVSARLCVGGLQPGDLVAIELKTQGKP